MCFINFDEFVKSRIHQVFGVSCLVFGIKNWTFSEDLTIDERGLYYFNVSKFAVLVFNISLTQCG